MARVILQPAGSKDARQHYVDTIENPVTIEHLAEFLPPERIRELEEIYPDGEVPTWGVTPGKNDLNKRKWERIQPGDVTLFSRQGAVIASAVTTVKLHNRKLALDLWGTDEDGETWEYVYFVDEVQGHQIPYERFNRAAGYKENYVIQGFNVLDEEKSWKILQSLELASEEYAPEVDREEFETAVRDWDPNEPLDRQTSTSQRVEQPFLRQDLFQNRRRATCCICQRELPVGLLTAAHVKPRADCTDEERVDSPNIVAPMCRLGCHVLYDKGFVGVRDGRTVVHIGKAMPGALEKRLRELEGNDVGVWEGSRPMYFRWHHENVFKG